MKKIMILLLSLCLSIFSVIAQETGGVDSVLEIAENAFRNGNDNLAVSPALAKKEYEKAAFYYNSLIEQGIQNGRIYYNTGNAYYRSGQTGKAILMYRRALLFSPSDPQIKYNLTQARKLQKNELFYTRGNDLIRILLFPHNNIPIAWKLLSFIAINIGFWGYLIFLRFNRLTRTPLFISGFILLLLISSLIFDLREASFQHGVITAAESVGRMGDSINFESSFDTPLFQGLEFKVKEKRAGWILAQLNNGDITWIEEKDCEIVEDL